MGLFELPKNPNLSHFSGSKFKSIKKAGGETILRCFTPTIDKEPKLLANKVSKKKQPKG